MTRILRDIKSADEFDQVYDIMDASFPKTEHRPYEKQKKLLDNPAYRLFGVNRGAADADAAGSRIDAFAAVWEFEEFTYLEHFAVRPGLRSQGIGSAVLGNLQEIYDRPICLEVELPETEQAVHRIGFYKRNHYYFNDYTYEQPKLSEQYPAVPLRIMTSGRPISRQEFEKVRSILYRRVYGILT